MAHQRFSPIGEYQPLHINATATNAPVGLCVSTTSATTITAGTGVVVTPTSMSNIYVGQYLNIANGTGTAENVLVKSVASTTFTADFANNHSGVYTIISRRGVYLGPVTINNPGSSCTLTLYNGHPSLLPDAGTAIAIINAAVTTPLTFGCDCNKGLFYTVTGTTIGDFTLMYLDHSN